MTKPMYNNNVEVAGIKPVADGIEYHTRYQAHNIITDEVKECHDLAILVESTLVWKDEPSNAINWYEVTYQGNKQFFSQEDKVSSEFLNQQMKRMAYTLRDTLRFNNALLAGEVLDLEEPKDTLVTMTVVLKVEGDITEDMEDYDPGTLLRDAVEGKYELLSTDIDDVVTQEVL